MSPQEEELYGIIVDADLPHYFKEYVQTELYCLKKKEYRITETIWLFWSRNDGRPELPPQNFIGDCWDFIYQTSRDSTKFNEKIRAAFVDFLRRYFNSGHSYLVQVWAKEHGRYLLTTQHLPFALHLHVQDSAFAFFGSEEFQRLMFLLKKREEREEIQGLCEYRMICKEHIYYLDDDTQKHELLEGIPGRVFRNQSPEFSPNVEYYSPTEYPLLQHALRCQVRSSFAFPVFEPSGQTCLGVVEIVSSTTNPYVYDFLHMLPNALKAVGLNCSAESPEHRKEQMQGMSETHKAAWKEISKVSKVVREVHKLRLGHIWVPCRTCSALVDSRGCTPLTTLIKLEEYTLMYDDDGEESFSIFCNCFHLRKGSGAVGRAYLSCGLIYCTDVTQFSLAEYSLSHYARQYGFSGCFAICLQSSENDSFVLEFFFPKSFNYGDPWTSLKEILQTMKENCQSLKLVSGAELTEELLIEVIDFQNGEKVHYISPLYELLKNGGMAQMDSSGQQSNDFHNVMIMDLVPLLHAHELFQDGVMPQDSSDQQYAINNRSRVVSVEPSNINVTCAEERSTERIPQRESKKRGVKIVVTREEILQHSGISLMAAAEKLEVSRSTLKRACRNYGYEKWPPREKKEVGHLSESLPCGVDQEQIPQLKSNAPSGKALAGVAQTRPQMMQDEDNVTIKAKYGNEIIKFTLSSSSGMIELQHELAKRLKLESGTYCMKYKDKDNDLVSIICDEDLQYLVRTSRSECVTPLVIFLELKSMMF